MRLVSVLAALAGAAAFGCSVSFHPAPRPEPAPADELRRLLATWTVGVREPVIRYGELGVPGVDLSEEIRDAGQLVGLLIDTNLFARVDFTRELGCAPQLELVARPLDGARLGPGPAWLWLVAGGMAIDEAAGIDFTPVGDPDAVFAFPYRNLLLVGFVPAAASPVLLTGVFPRLTFMGGGPVERDFERFLLENGEQLARFAREPQADSCTPG